MKAITTIFESTLRDDAQVSTPAEELLSAGPRTTSWGWGS
jgi:hypothetical protein